MKEEIIISLKLDEKNRGGFYVFKNDEKVGEMTIAIKENSLIVFHTEVSDGLKEFQLGKRLLDQMVQYARENNLKVVPYCPFVRAQFRRHESEYRDVWQQTEE